MQSINGGGVSFKTTSGGSNYHFTAPKADVFQCFFPKCFQPSGHFPGIVPASGSSDCHRKPNDGTGPPLREKSMMAWEKPRCFVEQVKGDQMELPPYLIYSFWYSKVMSSWIKNTYIYSICVNWTNQTIHKWGKKTLSFSHSFISSNYHQWEYESHRLLLAFRQGRWTFGYRLFVHLTTQKGADPLWLSHQSKWDHFPKVRDVK